MESITEDICSSSNIFWAFLDWKCSISSLFYAVWICSQDYCDYYHTWIYFDLGLNSPWCLLKPLEKIYISNSFNFSTVVPSYGSVFKQLTVGEVNNYGVYFALIFIWSFFYLYKSLDSFSELI